MIVGTSRLSSCYNQRLESILMNYPAKSWREKQSAVAKIEREFGRKLYQKALKITSVREDAEEAVLHGLVVLVTQLANGHLINRPWGLLSTAVKNYSLNQALARTRRELVESLDEAPVGCDSREDIARSLEAQDLVAFALKRLQSDLDRDIISLRGMYGFEFGEIAELLVRKHGRSIGPRGVKARYDRACKKLRGLLLEELTMKFRSSLNLTDKFNLCMVLAGMVEAVLEKPSEEIASLAGPRLERSRSGHRQTYSSTRIVRRAVEALRLTEARMLPINLDAITQDRSNNGIDLLIQSLLSKSRSSCYGLEEGKRAFLQVLCN